MTVSANQEMRSRRESQNISVAQLGAMIGVSKATISRYETGDQQPNIDTIGKIADSLSIKSFDLIKEDKMTLSETYQLTLRQEVLREIAFGLQAKFFKLTKALKINDDTNPLNLMSLQLSEVTNDGIFDAESMQDLDKIEGYLDRISDLLESITEKSIHEVA